MPKNSKLLLSSLYHRYIIVILSTNTFYKETLSRANARTDKTVDIEEGFYMMRAYICIGSSDWLKGKTSDNPDIKLIKWVRQFKQQFK